MSLTSRTQHSPATSAPLSSRFSSALRGQALPSNDMMPVCFSCCLHLQIHDAMYLLSHRLQSKVSYSKSNTPDCGQAEFPETRKDV